MDTVALLKIGNSKIGLHVEHIERVLRAVAITPLPNQSRGVLGVINVEGSLIKVSDLRARLGLPTKVLELDDQIVIVETDGQRVAIVVDAVSSVVHYTQNNFTAFNQAESPSALGALNVDDEIVVVCNPSEFLAPML